MAKEKKAKNKKLATRKMALVTKTNLLVSFISIAGVLLLSISAYTQMKAANLSQIKERAMSTASSAAAIVKGDMFADVLENGEESEYYDEAYERLAAFRDNAGVEYIYTFTKNSAGTFFVIDTDTEEPADYMEEYDPNGSMDIAFEGNVCADEAPTSDEWGTFISAFAPIMQNGKVLGVVGVDVDYSDIQAQQQNFLIRVVIVAALTLIILNLGILIILKNMKRGFVGINSKVEALTAGDKDLTKLVEEHGGDEFETIAGNVNRFIAEIHDLVSGVSSMSEQTKTLMDSLNKEMADASQSSENITAFMEEISATMQTVSSSTQEVMALSQEMAAAVQEIMNSLADGRELVDDIHYRAGGIRGNTVEKKQFVTDTVARTKGDLEDSIEASKQVELIMGLTQDILAIAGQTNLLALNASIEAARAGEAGRGFAVVADEINTLSDNSRKTAEKIKDIVSVVTTAVESLRNNAGEMLVLVENEMLPDYETFLSIADNYETDAEHIRTWLVSYQTAGENLANGIEVINNNIANISESVVECDAGVASSAEDISALSNVLGSVSEAADETKNAVDRLKEEADQYKI